MKPSLYQKKATHKGEVSTAQPGHEADVGRTNRAVDGKGRGASRPHQRFAAAVGRAHYRLWHKPNIPGGTVWTSRMTLIAIVGLILAAAAGTIDAAVTAFVRGSNAPWIGWMAYATDVGSSQWYLVPAAVIFLTAGFADWTRAGMRGRSRLAMLFGQAGFSFAAVALSGILVNILKIFFGRARPILFEQHGAYHFEPLSVGYAFASFPSGHSTTVGAVTGILILWYPRFTALLVLAGLFFSATRIAARAHYPSDVATGFLFGVLFTIALARFLATRGVVFRLQDRRLLPSVIGLLKK
jgi:undecaprenyl-diphosphatase